MEKNALLILFFIVKNFFFVGFWIKLMFFIHSLETFDLVKKLVNLVLFLYNCSYLVSVLVIQLFQ
ncbi:MAG: hypothetical protein CM15mP107_2470 [Bacteroidota bacterium]|nr:MAG: hypothetical protein CM15mP107_2470 [Bacteroidota bacterium]